LTISWLTVSKNTIKNRTFKLLTGAREFIANCYTGDRKLMDLLECSIIQGFTFKIVVTLVQFVSSMNYDKKITMLKLPITLWLLALPFVAYMQEITGTVTNQEGEPIPYATIYIEELQTGTSTNQQGKYNLKIKPGNYHLNFRSIGFAPQTKEVLMGSSPLALDVVLPWQSYILAGVTVRADAEDPAYSVMRKAIARAPGFLKMADSYTSQVYIKGSVKASKIPKILAKRMEVNGENPKEGETYVNESLNRIRFKAPNNYEQEVISVNNTFPMGESEVPVIGLISGSIYESQDDFYISPFAPNAFSHYTFKYAGLLQDGDWFIDKIQVIPKRKSKLLMEGYLYIVEDLWCLYSYDIKLSPPYSDLKIKQHYAPVAGNNYFPVNMFVEADISFMGIKASGTYTTTFKYDSVVLNPIFSQKKIQKAITYNLEPTVPVEAEAPKDPKIAEIDAKLEKLYQTEELTNREMTEMQKLMAKKASLLEEEQRTDPLELTSAYKQIKSKNALIRDSIYWDSVRPVPASADEKFSYQKKLEQQAKEDSTPKWKKALRTAVFGNYEWERSKKFYTFYPGLLNVRNVGFNPVDSWQLEQSLKMRWRIDSLRTTELKGMVGYSFGREAFYTKQNLTLWYNPMKRAAFIIDAGYLSQDFKTHLGAPEPISALYNLFMKESFIKFYHDKYVDLENRIDIANGFYWVAGGKWQQADSVGNSTNFSVLYPNAGYDLNIPEGQTASLSAFSSNMMLQFRTSFEYTPFYYYEIEKGVKHYLKSDWPTFQLGYRIAIPVTGDYSKFQNVELFVRQDIDFYTVSSLFYQINAGIYYEKENMHFSSFKHFKTLEEPFTTRDFKRGFFLMDTYGYSTNSKYLEMHTQYTTQFLLLKLLPWISNQLWTENVYASCLFTDESRPFYEFGYSIGQILFAGEIGAFTSFKGANFDGFGVRATFKFD